MAQELPPELPPSLGFIFSCFQFSIPTRIVPWNNLFKVGHLWLRHYAQRVLCGLYGSQLSIEKVLMCLGNEYPRLNFPAERHMAVATNCVAQLAPVIGPRG